MKTAMLIKKKKAITLKEPMVRWTRLISSHRTKIPNMFTNSGNIAIRTMRTPNR